MGDRMKLSDAIEKKVEAIRLRKVGLFEGRVCRDVPKYWHEAGGYVCKSCPFGMTRLMRGKGVYTNCYGFFNSIYWGRRAAAKYEQIALEIALDLRAVGL